MYTLQEQELEEAIADAVDIGEKEVLVGLGTLFLNHKDGLSGSLDFHDWVCLFVYHQEEEKEEELELQQEAEDDEQEVEDNEPEAERDGKENAEANDDEKKQVFNNVTHAHVMHMFNDHI
jgi:hypothetical protein